MLRSAKEIAAIPVAGRHEYLYIIDEEGNLFLYPSRHASVIHFELPPTHRDDKREESYYAQSELADRKPLVAAGYAEIINIDGVVTIELINNQAPEYSHPNGPHMSTVVEHVFNRHGFDATGKFQPYIFDENILIKERIKMKLEQVHLPYEDRTAGISFETPELYDPDLPLPTLLVEDRMAYVDRWGSLWFGGPEWEVHFSPAGKERFSHLIKDAEKMTVSHVGTFKPFEGK